MDIPNIQQDPVAWFAMIATILQEVRLFWNKIRSKGGN